MSSLATSLAWLVALLTLLYSQGPSLLALGPAMVLLYRLAARLMAPRRIGAQEDLNVIIGEWEVGHWGWREVLRKPASTSTVLVEHFWIIPNTFCKHLCNIIANSLFVPAYAFP